MSDVSEMQILNAIFDVKDVVARAALGNKANSADVYTKAQIDTMMSATDLGLSIVDGVLCVTYELPIK